MSDHPYASLPPRAFWKSAMGGRKVDQLEGLWTPKYSIGQADLVSTYGSCFAQHIARTMRERDYSWFDAEPAPYDLPRDAAKKFNYGVFSSRTGNIYTPTLLLQWAEWAFGEAKPPEEVWEVAGRVYDPFRPRIEPNGFADKDEMLGSRDVTLEAFRKSVSEADVFVFTLGLTERWINDGSGYEYPMCPGTAAGTFDASAHKFDNLGTQPILEALRRVIEIFREVNSRLNLLFTVSPVPLTATASGEHVLVATMHSKAILRAAAGHIVEQYPFVDYFPSYEIVSNPIFGGGFFEENRRSVAADGVAHVMDTFFRSMTGAFGEDFNVEAAARRSKRARKAEADLVCEEELLASFGGRK